MDRHCATLAPPFSRKPPATQAVISRTKGSARRNFIGADNALCNKDVGQTA
jgi:hypothetical protein